MTAQDVTLTRARAAQKETLARLFQLYLYDISEFAHWPINDVAHYELADRLLTPFFEAADHHPYLIKIADELAGFCLINRAPDNAQVWDMGQFFILRKFRSTGVAHAAFQHATTRHTGHWQVRVLPANKPALKFWTTSTHTLSHGHVTLDTTLHNALTMTRLSFQTRP